MNKIHKSPSPDTGDDGWRRLPLRLDNSGNAHHLLLGVLATPGIDVKHSLNQIARECVGDDPVQLRLRAASLVIRDLIELGWETRSDEHWIYVRPFGDQGVTKDATRRGLEFGRNNQLQEPATRRFILSMERPSRYSNALPVTDLIADGRSLAHQLRASVALPPAQQRHALGMICDPYLQLVENGARDEFSKLRLSDIWRYFRHSWSTRYRTTPGRNLFYLVRDRAERNHPIIGIAALGNAVLQLGPRDQELGWTVQSLMAGVNSGEIDDRLLLDALRKRIRSDIDAIYRIDLPTFDLDEAAISDELLDRLRVIETKSVHQRTDVLRGVTELNADQELVPEHDYAASATSPLFRAKRARAMRDLLQTYRNLTSVESVKALYDHADGPWALNQAIRQLKKHFGAAGMMEITVCGSVPPYNHLLGGKLVALLMASPQVVRDYEARYGASISIIASQMAGKAIRKPSKLVFLGTTSLYARNSSQYNRLSLPAATFGSQTHEVRYSKLGTSEGFGSPNFSSETESALERLTSRNREFRNVNFVFGEGHSPKMRQLRDGFNALGLAGTDLLNHGSRRIVYGVDLIENLRAYLLGIETQPRYRLPPDGAISPIVNFWRSRWLSSRLHFAPAVNAVAKSTPLSERVSRLIAAPAEEYIQFDMRRREENSQVAESTREDEKTAFIRQLYRDESAYSDHVKLSRLRELNVKTRLEDVVKKVVRSGGTVVITGNAGDGKTHTIRLLESDLKSASARYIVDASEHTQDQVMEVWATARRERQPFCIAINEGPLIELIRSYRQQHEWLDDVRRQLLSATTLVPVETGLIDEKYAPQPGATVVIDLSHRRVLSPDLLRPVILKLTDDSWFAACKSCPRDKSCPVSYNRQMLRNARVQDRLVELLHRVAERGVRATFRELLAYVSYLIFGGRTCSELLEDPLSERNRYYWHAFEGQGLLFEQLEVGLDPLRQTNARVDERLWRGDYRSVDFAGGELMPVLARDLDELRGQYSDDAADSFVALKRRWYFEHADGRVGHATDSDRFFSELQDSQLSTQLRVGRLVEKINGWWNVADRGQQDKLRLWTRLSYSPRAEGKAMVAGREVPNLLLKLFRPQLSTVLHAAFGQQATDFLVLAPPENLRFSSLVVDRRLIMELLVGGVGEQAQALGRRLRQFNDALAKHAETGSHVRTIELFDPGKDMSVKVRVDLNQRRYDSAQ